MKASRLTAKGIVEVLLIAGAVSIMAVALSAQSLTIDSPRGNTTWRAGTTQTITWTIRTPNPSMGQVMMRLSYRVMPGSVWSDIGQTEAFRQRYEWAIPASVSGQVMIRAVWSLEVPIAVNSPTFLIVSSGKQVKGPAASDYSLVSVAFQDGRPLNQGIMYDRNFLNDMRLLVRIRWNKVPARYGLQCVNHKLSIVDGRGLLIYNPNPVPAPDADGLIAMPVLVKIPALLEEGSDYFFRVRFQPADRECDAIAGNNERTFSTRLVRMGGNDLVVRLIDAKKVWNASLAHWDLHVHYDMMNVSGTEPLREVFVRLEIEGTSEHIRLRLRNFRAHTWKSYTHIIPAVAESLLGGEFFVIVTVDPDNQIAELREDNNQDRKRFGRD